MSLIDVSHRWCLADFQESKVLNPEDENELVPFVPGALEHLYEALVFRDVEIMPPAFVSLALAVQDSFLSAPRAENVEDLALLKEIEQIHFMI
ncbi:hypothetical protein OJ996_24575 [Luteolibacter sp. GHJ8]|uniref:Uncharacterized protein n=1 Tax=Luteolibacter rhizosphaerae TaxID=2989719 RepID=A0ABT3GBC6_9BACT|nr:hypothetical protein [Luteolibacter rhizosphaerae]MCW1916786.1 hypothetical protein [Luteolibacter rhizosphaerae]